MTTAVSRVTPCPPGFSDHVYKVAHGVEIPLRIWPAPLGHGQERQVKEQRPWLFWIHGGGFIGGKHAVPNAWVINAFHGRGYHVVSIAYRFMPHVQLPDIMQDTLDAYAWCRRTLPHLIGPRLIDIDACVVAGDSAGGTMSTLCGLYLDPKPRVVVDVFGVVDMTDPHFYVRAADRQLKEAFGYLDPRDPDELDRALAERDPARAEVISPWSWELEPRMSQAELRVFWGMPDFTVGEEHRFRMDMNTHLNLTGKRMELLLQRERYGTEDEYWKEVKGKWSVLHLVDGRYPPTFLMHGTADPAVPVEQSYAMEKKLRELGVAVGAVYCPGGLHCFDNKIEKPGDDGWKEYIEPCMDFIDRYIGA